MNCLHICNDLLGSKVHANLYNQLAHIGLQQTLFYPARPNTLHKVGQWNPALGGSLIASRPLSHWHRIFFRRKIDFLFKDLESKADLSQFDVVHATTLLSDGALALKIHRKYGIPFVVAVRGTDINLFLKYRKDLTGLTNQIIEYASKIVFISESLRQNFFNTPLVKKRADLIRHKCDLVPNGIDRFWLENIRPFRPQLPSKILYIGRFDSNKNVLRLIEAFLLLRKQFPNLELNLIGKGGSQENSIKEIVARNPGIINFHGPVYDKDALKKHFEANHIFAMISKGETFGLVYVEALTQGLPILYTRNQGIDGTFKEHVGEAVNPKSVESICEGLKTMLNSYSGYELDSLDFSIFAWEKIAQTYLEMYHTIHIGQ